MGSVGWDKRRFSTMAVLASRRGAGGTRRPERTGQRIGGWITRAEGAGAYDPDSALSGHAPRKVNKLATTASPGRRPRRLSRSSTGLATIVATSRRGPRTFVPSFSHFVAWFLRLTYSPPTIRPDSNGPSASPVNLNAPVGASKGSGSLQGRQCRPAGHQARTGPPDAGNGL